jgi:hypothetical protein
MSFVASGQLSIGVHTPVAPVMGDPVVGGGDVSGLVEAPSSVGPPSGSVAPPSVGPASDAPPTLAEATGCPTLPPLQPTTMASADARATYREPTPNLEIGRRIDRSSAVSGRIATREARTDSPGARVLVLPYVDEFRTTLLHLAARQARLKPGARTVWAAPRVLTFGRSMDHQRGSMDLHPDFKDLLSALAATSAEHLVVGGWAVGNHVSKCSPRKRGNAPGSHRESRSGGRSHPPIRRCLVA